MMTKAHRGKSGSAAATKTAGSATGGKKSQVSSSLRGFMKHCTKKSPACLKE